MESSRFTVFKDLIKDLADTCDKASKAVEHKADTLKKLTDPSNPSAPRSIRQKLFTLTTLTEFRDIPTFKELQTRAAEHCAQYRANLAATIKELACHEVQWLKHYRLQQILPKMKSILEGLIFRTEQNINRPQFSAIVTNTTLPFFLFYWLLKDNVIHNKALEEPSQYLTFFELPFDEIIEIAAHSLIDNSPQFIENVISQILRHDAEWDVDDTQAINYLNVILLDLHRVIASATFEYVSYQRNISQAETAEAKTKAFVNKLRIKKVTILTNEAIEKATNSSNNENTNLKDLKLRAANLEKQIAQQGAFLNSLNSSFLKQQQINQAKNSSGSQSAQKPQFKSTNHPKFQPSAPFNPTNHPKFQPAQHATMSMNSNVTRNEPTQTTTADTGSNHTRNDFVTNVATTTKTSSNKKTKNRRNRSNNNKK